MSRVVLLSKSNVFFFAYFLDYSANDLGLFDSDQLPAKHNPDDLGFVSPFSPLPLLSLQEIG